MINDIKLGFKLFPYTLNFKGLRFSLILFVIIGVGFELAGFVTYQPTLATLGAYYIVLASLYFVQGINQMEYNYHVQRIPIMWFAFRDPMTTGRASWTTSFPSRRNIQS